MKSILLISILALFLNGCGSLDDYNFSNFSGTDPFSKIVIKEGISGKSFSFSKVEDINEIHKIFSQITFHKKKDQEDISGYKYMITFYDKESEYNIILVKDRLASINNEYFVMSDDILGKLSPFLLL